MKKISILFLCMAVLLTGCRHATIIDEAEIPGTVPSTAETTAETSTFESIINETITEEYGTNTTSELTIKTEAPSTTEITEPATTEQLKQSSESTTLKESVSEMQTAVTEATPITEKTTEAPSTTEVPKTTEAPKPVSISYPINYNDGDIKITIDKVWYVGAWCYVAHIQTSDYSRLKTGMAGNGYGAAEYPTTFSNRVTPLLMVNGDYSEGLGKSVLRNGKIYGDDSVEVQAVYSQSSGILKSGKSISLRTLLGDGFTDSFDFGASDLVVNGESVYLRKDGGKSAQRTLIGTTGTHGDIYLVVTEGRYSDGESRGLQYWEAGDFLQSLGCSYGIALDGGGSSEMIWRGQILNKSPERASTSFVYVTY